jgi:ribosomal protein bL25 (Ctc-form)
MDLLVQKRDLSVAPKVLLRGGFIPAELYGRGVSNIHLSVPAKEFRRVFATAGETTIVNLLVDGSTHPVLITDVTNDSLTGEPTHIDFYQIQAGQKITAPVPLEYVGEAPAVALGGVLTKAFSEIEVGVLQGAAAGLDEDRRLRLFGGLHDGLDLLHVVDVESADAVTALQGFFEDLTTRNERHFDS